MPRQRASTSVRSSGENNEQLTSAAVGIDLGMSFLRASIAVFETEAHKSSGLEKLPPIYIGRENPDDGNFESQGNEFGATVFDVSRFDSPEKSLGYATDTRESPFPLKMLCYLKRILRLLQDGDEVNANEIISRIPQIRQFWDKEMKGRSNRGQQAVVAQLEKVFHFLMKNVRACSYGTAGRNDMRIDKLVVTLPSNWDMCLQDMYIDLLRKKVWHDFKKDDIITVYESEAVAHWLLQSDRGWRRTPASRFMVVDFGGHTLSTVVFDVARRETGSAFAFFSVDNASKCIHGGSEYHTSLVTAALESKIEEKRLHLTRRQISYLIKECMANYRRTCRSSINGKGFHLEGKADHEPMSQLYVFIFEKEEAQKMYDDSFKRPLNEFNNQISKHAKNWDETVVVLSGGSFRNNFVHAEAVAGIKANGLTLWRWRDRMLDPTARSSMVSAGAALAVTRPMSVADFMKQAAFAIKTDQGDDENVPVIHNSQRSREVLVNFKGHQGEYVLITCAPLSPSDDAEEVPLEDTYQFLSLGRVGKGMYKYSLEYEHEEVDELAGGHPDWLKISEARSEYKEWMTPIVFRLPIFYDPGGCVCFIDWDYADQFRQPDGTQGIPLHKRLNWNWKSASKYDDWEIQQRDSARGQWKDDLDQTRQKLERPAPKLSRSTKSRSWSSRSGTKGNAGSDASLRTRATTRSHSSASQPPPAAHPSHVDSPLRNDSSSAPATLSSTTGRPQEGRPPSVDIYEIPDEGVGRVPSPYVTQQSPLKRRAEGLPDRPAKNRAPMAPMNENAVHTL